MICRKCGGELHPDQKVCIQCGTRTARGGGFDFEQKEQWRPTRNTIIGAAGVVLLLIIILVVKSLQTIPPEVVAGEWFDAMAGRRVGTAKNISTPNLERDLSSRMMDMMALSDEYYTEVANNRAKYTARKSKIDEGAKHPRAKVVIALTYPEGESREVTVELVKVGRQWRVDRVSN